jgi:hypothetical protein
MDTPYPAQSCGPTHPWVSWLWDDAVAEIAGKNPARRTTPCRRMRVPLEQRVLTLLQTAKEPLTATMIARSTAMGGQRPLIMQALRGLVLRRQVKIVRRREPGANRSQRFKAAA